MVVQKIDTVRRAGEVSYSQRNTQYLHFVARNFQLCQFNKKVCMSVTFCLRAQKAGSTAAAFDPIREIDCQMCPMPNTMPKE